MKRIIVPLDGSELAEMALPYAREIATAAGAELVLVSAVHQAGVWDTTLSVAVLDRERTLAEEYLDRKQAELGKVGAGLRFRVMQGPAAEAILVAAEEEDADMIAISTHGRTGIGRFLFGSVANKLVQSTDIPLLVIRPQDGQKQPPETVRLKKILVPLDGSEVAESVVPYVAQLAGTLGASVALFHAVPPLSGYPGFETAQPAAIGQVLEDMQKDARGFLSRVANGLKEQGIDASMVVTVDLASDGIMRAAEELDADLIAIGTHGRTGLGRMVLGSVADSVVRRSARPCLLLNPNRPGTTNVGD